ncbi:MAG: MFS transporter [Armatimonadia bacterium]
MVRWKSTLIASWLAQICSIVGFALVIPFLPFYVRELGVTDEKAVLLWCGWGLSTSAGLTMAIVAPIWGVLGDRHGRKLMVMRSMFGGVIVLALMGLVQNVHQLMALRILQGALTGTVSASIALVSSIVPTRRAGFALGLMQTAMFIGNSMGPWVGGNLAEQVGYRIPFVIAAGFLLVGGLLTAFGVHENFDPNEMVEDENGATTIRQVLAITGFTTMIGLLFMIQFSGSFIGPILPLYIERISGLHGHASSITGNILCLGGIAAAISATLLGLLGDKLGYGRVLVLCTLLTGLTLIPHGLAQTTHQLMFWRICTMFAGAGTIPAANALIRSMIPRHACGKAFGIVASVGCLGWGTGPAVGSTLAAHFGMRQPFFIVGGFFLLISLAVLIVIPRMQRRIAEQQVLDAAAEPCCSCTSDSADSSIAASS